MKNTAKKSLEQNEVIDLIFMAITIAFLLTSLFYEIGKDSYSLHPESFLW